MTKSQAQKALNQFLKNPADFIYLFATDSFVSKLSGVYHTTVYRKMRLQYKYINVLAIDAGGTFEEWREKFRQAIVEQYGKDPYEILVLLASGKDVAGKNWKEGVYGVGVVRYDGFKGTNITVDASTGDLLQGGTVIPGQTNVYTSSGKLVGRTATVDGVQYQSDLSGGKFYAGTYGTSEGAFNADGSSFSPANAQSIFQNMFSFMEFFERLLSWIFSISQQIKDNFKLMTASTVAARQSDWIKTTKSSADSLLYFIAGAGIIALIFGGKK